MIIYLIRHATPDWTRDDLVYHLPPGPPLTEQGVAEARSLGEFLASSGLKKIYTSPLERCSRTAGIIAGITGAQVEVLPDLREWQPGEDRASILTRCWPILERACQPAAEGGPVALITHGLPIEVLLEELGLDETELVRNRIYDHRNVVPPAGVWEARRSSSEGNPSGSWQLRLVFVPETNERGATAP
jgi:broad specificity phosphatase PhoE